MDVMYAGFAGAKTGVLSTHPIHGVRPSGSLRSCTKIDWINFEHHVLYDGLAQQGKVSHRNVANNIVPYDLVTTFE